MGEIENHWRLGNTVIYIKICNEYRPESCRVSTLLGGMVRQYSCTVITFSQWIPFPLVVILWSSHPLRVSVGPQFLNQGSQPLWDTTSQRNPSHTFATCSLSGYRWSCSHIWKPCLSAVQPGSRHLAPMSSGYSCKPPLGQGTYFRHRKIQIGLSCPKHAGTHWLALHCNLHARF